MVGDESLRLGRFNQGPHVMLGPGAGRCEQNVCGAIGRNLPSFSAWKLDNRRSGAEALKGTEHTFDDVSKDVLAEGLMLSRSKEHYLVEWKAGSAGNEQHLAHAPRQESLLDEPTQTAAGSPIDEARDAVRRFLVFCNAGEQNLGPGEIESTQIRRDESQLHVQRSD